MAHAVSSSIPTTATHFALLHLESDTESEPEKGKSGQAAGKSQASEGRSSTNQKRREKRREKRRRKKEQQRIEASEDHENTEGTSPQSKTADKREKRMNQQGKDKPLTVSLEDFQSDSNIGNAAKKHEESGMKDEKTEQLQLELEKKDTEIQQLKNIIIQMKMKYKQVKAKNAQPLKTLQEGKMKEEIFKEVEELQTIMNELILQVTTLHVELEQARTKEKQLQAELTKYQSKKREEKHS